MVNYKDIADKSSPTWSHLCFLARVVPENITPTQVNNMLEGRLVTQARNTPYPELKSLFDN
jgi:hypothetical protein